MLYNLVRPILFSIDAERAHYLATNNANRILKVPGLKTLAKCCYKYESPKLEIELFNKKFSNPFGIAAGFDKNANCLELVAALGFGFMEIGSVSALPALGNPKPRLFRLLDDQALINRMGLNNDGAEVIARRLKSKTLPGQFILGINTVKTNDPNILEDKAISDFTTAVRVLAPQADFIVLNVSCPNSGDGRTFEDANALRLLLQAMQDVRGQTPLLVKLSSDLTDSALVAALETCEAMNVDGYVLINTTISRDGLKTSQHQLEAIGRGGLSGAPLFERVKKTISLTYKTIAGKKPIIGVGGVSSAADAYALFKAGASLVEVYTGFVYNGPGYAKALKRGLVKLLDRDGAGSIREIIGRGI
ncbi:quinone-dependent dihydroorotate dehydrogenase [bacterium]|nr:quinone-dependent dihydroorotate dehydrogenase [bacterium]